jgi:hypothetical protein
MAAVAKKARSGRRPAAWEQQLARRLPAFGHRNWIVVADAAYPEQANPGIETVVAGGDHLHAVRTVLDRIAACAHIRAHVYTDLEIGFLEERDAPGIGAFRKKLQAMLADMETEKLPHEEIIAKLDSCARLFRVLLIKTDLTLPYTSVFFELECGYWSADREQRLRRAIRE